jgi:hypothetical protein
MTRNSLFPILLTAISLECAAWGQVPFLRNNSILNSLQSITGSTIPSNGDLNPYGVAFVPAGFPSGGSIAAGDVLVANFNSSGNTQGTGTTIVSISPTGQQSLFATSTLPGVNTALGVLSSGYVLVGNLPVTYPNKVPTPGVGSLQIFDWKGNWVATLNDTNLLSSPWGLAIKDQGAAAQVFVSNASGNVTRLNLSINNNGVTVISKTQIGAGYTSQLIPAVVIAGPTGLAYDSIRDILFVASTADNEIFGIENASTQTTSSSTGFVVYADQTNLHGPLGLTLGANGNLIAANGDAVNAGGTQNALVEFTEQGSFVATYQLDSGAPGAAFGIASTNAQGAVRLAAVDDNLNALTVWTLR